uniref:Uncharacterized protein n=1 Tax=Glossina pallidipes TaxID=7398 RepID=A0A1B0ABL5_GLOPL
MDMRFDDSCILNTMQAYFTCLVSSVDLNKIPTHTICFRSFKARKKPPLNAVGAASSFCDGIITKHTELFVIDDTTIPLPDICRNTEKPASQILKLITSGCCSLYFAMAKLLEKDHEDSAASGTARLHATDRRHRHRHRRCRCNADNDVLSSLT